MEKITFPHLGSLYVAVEHYVRSMGREPVTPPFSSKHTFDLGIRSCPPMTCSPCKILFGNYHEGLTRGRSPDPVRGS